MRYGLTIAALVIALNPACESQKRSLDASLGRDSSSTSFDASAGADGPSGADISLHSDNGAGSEVYASTDSVPGVDTVTASDGGTAEDAALDPNPVDAANVDAANVEAPDAPSSTPAIDSAVADGERYDLLGAGPLLLLSPASLDFGSNIGIDTISASQTLTVTNTGDVDALALSVVREDTAANVGGAAAFPYTTSCTAVLAAGASCQIFVKFAPTIAGDLSASFTVIDGATGNPTASSPRSVVTGVAGAPIPPFPDCGGRVFVFSDTVVGKTSTISCRIQNSGASDRSVDGLTFQATRPFAVGSNDCPAALAPGSSCIVNVVFAPTAKGSVLGTFTVTTNNVGAANANLKGTGLGVVEIVELDNGVVADPQPYDFGQVAVGSTSDKVVTLAVYVRAPVGNISVTGTFGAPEAFALSDVDTITDLTIGDTSVGAVAGCDSDVPAKVDEGIPSCYKLVSFKPQARTRQYGTITATSGTGTNDTATVEGTGSGPISISPSPADFEDLAVGATGLVTLTVANGGPAQMKTFSLTITGPNADEYSVKQEDLTASVLGAKGSGTDHATVVVAFKPAAVVAATATLSVTGMTCDASGNPVESETKAVALLGNGTRGAE